MQPGFTAIDFETPNPRDGAACAVGIVVVEDGEIREAKSWLIDPETQDFQFSWIHGITLDDVEGAPTFGELWPEIAPMLRRRVLVAHNAPFDRGVLRACLRAYGLRFRAAGWVCTVRAARAVLGIYPTKLDMVCRRLAIPLQHHDALSDAHACARIALRAAAETGWEAVRRAAAV